MSSFDPINNLPKMGNAYQDYSGGIPQDGSNPVNGSGKVDPTGGTVITGTTPPKTPAPGAGQEPDDIPAPTTTDADQEVLDRLSISITNSTDALYEIYTILQLLQECANEQRSAAREARQADYKSEKTAIQRQAAELRTSASVGLGMGIAGSVLTVGSLITSGVLSIKGINSKLDLINKSDVPAASEALGTANGTVKSLTKEMTDFKKGLPQKTPAAQGPAGNADLPDVNPNPANADGNGVGAPAQGKAPGAEGVPQGDVPGAEGAPKGDVPDTAPNGADANSDAPKTDGKKADKKPETPPDVLDDSIDQNAMSEQDKEKWNVLKGKYKDAVDVQSDAQSNFDRALADLHSNPDYISAESSLQSGQTWQTVSQALGGLFTTLGQTSSQMISANATLEQVSQKDAEQEAEQETDLFKNAGDLRQSVLQLMSAVTQVEKDSLNKIINA